MIPNSSELFAEMNSRSREVFRRLVETYISLGDPVSSRALTRLMSEKVSAATIRNVMQDLEDMGLLDSPHISSGRIPTQLGLRMFVDSLLEVGELKDEDRKEIDQKFTQRHHDMEHFFDQVGSGLSRMTGVASLVLSPKKDAPVQHIEFVSLSEGRALVVLVFADGSIENRLFMPPPGQTPSSMREAANFLNSFISGRNLYDLRELIAKEISQRRQELDGLAQELVESGLAFWESGDSSNKRLIVRGRSHLISSKSEEQEIERVRYLFDDLEHKKGLVEFLDLTEAGEGVRIFIGSENKLFSLSGSSLVVSPYMNSDRKIIGAIGVIGPTRLNYGRIVPIVEYTAKVIGRLISERPFGG